MGNILIADDDANCRDAIQKVLQREGHLVRAAADVDGALEALGLEHFDLVVCDYRMPGKTGMELLLELRRLSSAVQVLMISAYADGPAEAAFRELGALGFLRKPIRRQQLIEQTARVVGG